MSLSALIIGTSHCYMYVLLHSNFHEYLSSHHDADKAGHASREDYITQTACSNILEYKCTCACVEFPHYLAWFYVCNKFSTASIPI